MKHARKIDNNSVTNTRHSIPSVSLTFLNIFTVKAILVSYYILSITFSW